jgi:hypothetical protein
MILWGVPNPNREAAESVVRAVAVRLVKASNCGCEEAEVVTGAFSRSVTW